MKVFLKKALIIRLISIFFLQTILPQGYVQGIVLPSAPGSMVQTSMSFSPSVIKGLKFDPQNPFLFDFYIDPGDSGQSQAQYQELIKYFLASLTVPHEDMWVNLSPYEKDRIIPDNFAQTAMGRALLVQDYLLKQMMSSLLYPEQEVGRAFWDKVYAQAFDKYGVTDIPVDTFHKVWITPSKATVYEKGNDVFIVNSHLKVMLEQDYVGNGFKPFHENDNISTDIIRSIVLPALEHEVNEGTHFAQLRQIYHSMILATWYKQRLKESLLSKSYVDQDKIDVRNNQPSTVNDVYNKYLEAFKLGAFNYIKEEYDPYTQDTIPRKYFSGGLVAPDKALVVTDASQLPKQDFANLTNTMNSQLDQALVSFNHTINGTDMTLTELRLVTYLMNKTEHNIEDFVRFGRDFLGLDQEELFKLMISLQDRKEFKPDPFGNPKKYTSFLKTYHFNDAEPTGNIKDYFQVIEDRAPIKCAHNFVVLSDGRIPIQVRNASGKGLWDTSVSGSLDIGLTSVQGAAKETEEELGLTMETSRFTPIINPMQGSGGYFRGSYDEDEIRLDKQTSIVHGPANVLTGNHIISLFYTVLTPEEEANWKFLENEEVGRLELLKPSELYRKFDEMGPKKAGELFSQGLYVVLMYPEVRRVLLEQERLLTADQSIISVDQAVKEITSYLDPVADLTGGIVFFDPRNIRTIHDVIDYARQYLRILSRSIDIRSLELSQAIAEAHAQINDFVSEHLGSEASIHQGFRNDAFMPRVVGADSAMQVLESKTFKLGKDESDGMTTGRQPLVAPVVVTAGEKYKFQVEISTAVKIKQIDVANNRTVKEMNIPDGTIFYVGRTNANKAVHLAADGDLQVSRQHFSILVTFDKETGEYSIIITDTESRSGISVEFMQYSQDASLDQFNASQLMSIYPQFLHISFINLIFNGKAGRILGAMPDTQHKPDMQLNDHITLIKLENAPGGGFSFDDDITAEHFPALATTIEGFNAAIRGPLDDFKQNAQHSFLFSGNITTQAGEKYLYKLSLSDHFGLRVFDGEIRKPASGYEPQVVPVQQPFYIGRGRSVGNDLIVTDDGHLSRSHFAILVMQDDDGEYRAHMQDLGSRSGTNPTPQLQPIDGETVLDFNIRRLRKLRERKDGDYLLMLNDRTKRIVGEQREGYPPRVRDIVRIPITLQSKKIQADLQVLSKLTELRNAIEGANADRAMVTFEQIFLEMKDILQPVVDLVGTPIPARYFNNVKTKKALIKAARKYLDDHDGADRTAAVAKAHQDIEKFVIDHQDDLVATASIDTSLPPAPTPRTPASPTPIISPAVISGILGKMSRHSGPSGFSSRADHAMTVQESVTSLSAGEAGDQQTGKDSALLTEVTLNSGQPMNIVDIERIIYEISQIIDDIYIFQPDGALDLFISYIYGLAYQRKRRNPFPFDSYLTERELMNADGLLDDQVGALLRNMMREDGEDLVYNVPFQERDNLPPSMNAIIATMEVDRVRKSFELEILEEQASPMFPEANVQRFVSTTNEIIESMAVHTEEKKFARQIQNVLGPFLDGTDQDYVILNTGYVLTAWQVEDFLRQTNRCLQMDPGFTDAAMSFYRFLTSSSHELSEDHRALLEELSFIPSGPLPEYVRELVINSLEIIEGNILIIKNPIKEGRFGPALHRYQLSSFVLDQMHAVSDATEIEVPLGMINAFDRGVLFQNFDFVRAYITFVQGQVDTAHEKLVENALSMIDQIEERWREIIPEDHTISPTRLGNMSAYIHDSLSMRGLPIKPIPQRSFGSYDDVRQAIRFSTEQLDVLDGIFEAEEHVGDPIRWRFSTARFGLQRIQRQLDQAIKTEWRDLAFQSGKRKAVQETIGRLQELASSIEPTLNEQGLGDDFEQARAWITTNVADDEITGDQKLVKLMPILERIESKVNVVLRQHDQEVLKFRNSHPNAVTFNLQGDLLEQEEARFKLSRFMRHYIGNAFGSIGMGLNSIRENVTQGRKSKRTIELINDILNQQSKINIYGSILRDLNDLDGFVQSQERVAGAESLFHQFFLFPAIKVLGDTTSEHLAATMKEIDGAMITSDQRTVTGDPLDGGISFDEAMLSIDRISDPSTLQNSYLEATPGFVPDFDYLDPVIIKIAPIIPANLPKFSQFKMQGSTNTVML